MGQRERTSRAEKVSQTLKTKITEQRDKLRKLEEEYKVHLNKETEKNQKLVMDLIRSEKLDLISIDDWRNALPSIASALKSGLPQTENCKQSSLT